jgi:two-component system, LytTR family, sensor kinase
MIDSIKRVFSNRVVIIFTHIAIWSLFLMLPLLMRFRTPPPMHFRKDMPAPMPNDFPNFEQFVVFSLVLIVFFYLNYYFLIPKILYRNKLGFYIICLLACFFVHHYSGQLFRYMMMGNNEREFPLFATILPVGFVLAVSLALRVTSDRLREDRERKEQETENLKSELSFLRSQISPHFLFNIMNNLVALNRKKSELVEPTLIKLSQLMRYMLYNSDEKKVSIEREIEYLESYIDLQKLRFGNILEVIFEKKGTDTEGGEIEPMLLIPFVENAFKHGTGMIQNPVIKINLLFEHNELIFSVLNKYNPLSIEAKDSDSGIGLKNVSRRLTLLYGKNHSLSAAPDGDMFNVNLKIKIPNPS